MVKPFWTTSTKRRSLRQPRRLAAWLTAALLGGLLPLAFVSEAQAFPILGGLLRGLGRLFGGLLLLVGGSVHDHGREQLQISILAKEQVKVALMAGTEEALGDVLDEVATWDSIRVAWLGEYERQLAKAPAFDYETAPAQAQRFEKALSGRDRALLAFMDNRSRTRELWTGFDPHFASTQGDPLVSIREATESALGAQTGIVRLMKEEHETFDVDADEIARFMGRIDTLAYVQQMRDMKAQGLLLHVKQLQHLRY
ncbi:MAG: hypothetical protein ACE5G0_07635, partial [Rhodothermales bacterium]